MALGSSRLPEAVEALERAWSSTKNPDLHESLARALSVSRQPRAFEFLLDRLRNGRPAEAVAALEALRLHRASPDIWRRVEQVAQDAGTDVEERFRRIEASRR